MAELLGILAGVALAAILFKPIFGDQLGFGDFVKLSSRGDLSWLLQGRLGQAQWVKLKIGCWIVISLLFGVSVSSGIERLIDPSLSP